MSNILRVKDGNGNWITIPALVGPKGDKGDKGDTGTFDSSALSAYALKADIATTKSVGSATSATSYFKISNFGAWGTGNWTAKGFSMLITSRAGEMIWVTVAANDSNTDARAIRLMNRYSKIANVYYSVSESAIYVRCAAWCNNVCAHILSNVYGDYVPTVATVSGLASDCVEINIVEFGINATSAVVGDSSVLLEFGGSADRPTYNGSKMALQSDIPEAVSGPAGPAGADGKDGVSCTHSWNGTTLTVTSASGTSSANLKGDKGDKGDTGPAGPTGTFDSSALANYAVKNAGNTFDGEQKMLNSSYCPTMNDIASGIGCSLKNSRACDNQLIVGEVWAPTTAASDGTINMTSTAGEIPFYKANGASNGQFSGKTQMARITSSGIYEGSTLLANKYAPKSHSHSEYMPKSGGKWDGPIAFQDSSLPQKNLPFVCGIDAFADGGQMGWQSKDEFLADCIRSGGGTMNGRLYTNEWIQFNGATGLFFPNQENTHFMPNTVSTYAPLRVTGTRGSYTGFLLGDDAAGLNVMSTAEHQGLYNESMGRWIIYYNRPSNKMSIGGATLTDSLLNIEGSVSAGKITQGSPSADSTVASMNRFQTDLFVQGDGSAPNVPKVAGFYLGKSASDENRHMDIVSGDTYSYIDFNKVGNNLDYDVRLLVDVNTGLATFMWDGSKPSKILNINGTLQQNGVNVATMADLNAAVAGGAVAMSTATIRSICT